jgi:cyclophilin family peptidyl-prolyl cis-trans isomerase
MRVTKLHRTRLRRIGRPSTPKRLLVIIVLVVAAGAQTMLAQIAGTNPVVHFHTDLGEMDVLLLQDVAPNTVANFLPYVRRGNYDNTFFHRSIPNFVIQGGGFTWNGQAIAIRQDAPVANEFHVSNTRGTLAMAKMAGDPNSATNQWFFNESDSNAGPPADLDTQNGGFTVFGRVIDGASLATMDTIGAVPVYVFQPPFDSVPLRDPYHYPDPPQDANLVHVAWIKVVPQIVALTHPTASTIHVQGRGQASTTYKLEMSSSPVATGFTKSVNVTTGTMGNFNFDDNSPGTKKFYRMAIP